jgi:DNA-binding XRE family transcriptional regulator
MVEKDLESIRLLKRYTKQEMAAFIGCDRKTYRKYEAQPEAYPAWKMQGILQLAKKAPKK